MQAVILSIGDELALGQTVDTNAAWLSARLAGRGIHTQLQITVADDRRAITEALEVAVDQTDLIIATGGLGPTEDDLTRFALADLLGVDLSLDDNALKQIRRFFEQRHRPMVDRNRVQALCPAGARMLDNPIGTAPGIRAELKGTEIYCLPGVPVEMVEMFDRHLATTLGQRSGRVILSSILHTFGKGESAIAEMLGDLADRSRNPLVGTTVSQGIVSVRLRSEFDDYDIALQRMHETTEQVTRCLGELVFGYNSDTLASVIGRMLSSTGHTLATAESCTGGLLGASITEVPGASEFFRGGWVSYDNQMKIDQLGVDAAMLEKHGAVSEPVARAMAEGAARQAHADFALSTTGIAGPSGGTPDKPVGTVWIALAERRRRNDFAVTAERFMLPGDRQIIRLRAAHAALNMLRLHVMRSEPPKAAGVCPPKLPKLASP
jgi:nicotinamide-nucleotide amidase